MHRYAPGTVAQVAAKAVNAADGATGLKRINITINQEHMAILRDFGDGKLSLGIRRAADLIEKHHLITK